MRRLAKSCFTSFWILISISQVEATIHDQTDSHPINLENLDPTENPCRFAQFLSLADMEYHGPLKVTVTHHKGVLALPSFVIAKPQSQLLSDHVLQLQVHSIRRSWGWDCKFKSNQAIAKSLQWEDWSSVAESSCTHLNIEVLRRSSHPEIDKLELVTWSERLTKSGPEWILSPITYTKDAGEVLGISVPVQRTSVSFEPQRYAGMHYCKLVQPQ